MFHKSDGLVNDVVLVLGEFELGALHTVVLLRLLLVRLWLQARAGLFEQFIYVFLRLPSRKHIAIIFHDKLVGFGQKVVDEVPMNFSGGNRCLAVRDFRPFHLSIWDRHVIMPYIAERNRTLLIGKVVLAGIGDAVIADKL